MPSGRGFSGGGGGHFGGGFSGGGHGHSSSSGSSSRSRGTVNGHSVVIFNGFGGRRYYVSNGVSSGMSIMSFFAICLIAIGIILLNLGYTVAADNKQAIQTIEQDYAKYQSFVTRATNNPDYKTTANVIAKERYKSSDKYCLRYEFKDKNGQMVEGYTFYTYTEAEANEAFMLDELEIALDTLNTKITQLTDSVDMHYGQTTLEDDAEYLYLISKDVKGIERGFKLGGYFALLGGIALIVVSIVIYYKKRKLYEENQKAQEVAKKEAEEAAKPKSKFCVYCGSKISEQDKKCSSCGASVRKD